MLVDDVKSQDTGNDRHQKAADQSHVKIRRHYFSGKQENDWFGLYDKHGQHLIDVSFETAVKVATGARSLDSILTNGR